MLKILKYALLLLFATAGVAQGQVTTWQANSGYITSIQNQLNAINLNIFPLQANKSANGFQITNMNATPCTGCALSEGNPIGATTRSSGLFTTLGANGQISSTLATGVTTPLSITSKTLSNAAITPFYNAVSFAASVTPNLDNGTYIEIPALTGNITINAPTATGTIPTGTGITIRLVQDAIGGRTVTWGVGFRQLWTDTGNVAGAQADISFQFTSGGVWNQVAWTPYSGGLPIVTITTQKFTASGTYTPHTGILFAIVECVGGGGGGGGAVGAAGDGSAAGGGGAGGYSKVRLTAAQIGASQTVTIGALGGGAAAGNNVGTAGGQTSVGTLCVANGGGGGNGAAAGAVNFGGAGGTAGTGDIAATGQPGYAGTGGGTITTDSVMSGAGGSTLYGGGAGSAGLSAGGTGASTGAAGSGFGSGGAGGAVMNTAINVGGGAGTAGIVYITEYNNQ